MMLVANDKGGIRHSPKIGVNCYCPGCNAPVIAVMGDIYKHHWRHVSDEGCTHGYGETQWHLRVKSLFPIDCIEVRKDGFVSDVLLPNGTAVEVQHSSIDTYTVQCRNNSRERVVWIFDTRDQEDRGQLEVLQNDFWYSRPKEAYYECGDMLFWYCSAQMIIQPKWMRTVYIENDKTGYNVKTLTGGYRIYDEKEFAQMIIDWDRSFYVEPDAPKYIQTSLFNISPDDY